MLALGLGAGALVVVWFWLRGVLFAAFVLFWPAEALLVMLMRDAPDGHRYGGPAVLFASVMLAYLLCTPFLVREYAFRPMTPAKERWLRQG